MTPFLMLSVKHTARVTIPPTTVKVIMATMHACAPAALDDAAVGGAADVGAGGGGHAAHPGLQPPLADPDAPAAGLAHGGDANAAAAAGAAAAGAAAAELPAGPKPFSNTVAFFQSAWNCCVRAGSAWTVLQSCVASIQMKIRHRLIDAAAERSQRMQWLQNQQAGEEPNMLPRCASGHMIVLGDTRVLRRSGPVSDQGAWLLDPS